MNPFITLTSYESNTPIRFNVNHIIQYHRSERGYTFLLLAGNCTREIQETPEEIDEMISNTFLTLVTHIG